MSEEANLLKRLPLLSDLTGSARIQAQLSGSGVILYMKGTPDFPQCGFSSQVVGALRGLSVPFSYVNIFEDPEVRVTLKAYSNWPTFPQLYLNGELIGGCDISWTCTDPANSAR
jgi:monothiol glutaredoxin